MDPGGQHCSFVRFFVPFFIRIRVLVAVGGYVFELDVFTVGVLRGGFLILAGEAGLISRGFVGWVGWVGVFGEDDAAVGVFGHVRGLACTRGVRLLLVLLLVRMVHR